MTIILENICKEFNGKNVINDFNAEIEWDRCYAFVGPQGSGKSTLLKIFMGTVEPDGGQVSRMGDYKYPTLHSAYVPQQCALNLKKSAVWNVKKAHRWASKKGAADELSGFISIERMDIPTAELTDVEKRYVEIVKALYVPADFIVLDEPFMGMSEQEREAALSYIMSKRGSRPLIIAQRDDNGLDFAKKYRLTVSN